MTIPLNLSLRDPYNAYLIKKYICFLGGCETCTKCGINIFTVCKALFENAVFMDSRSPGLNFPFHHSFLCSMGDTRAWIVFEACDIYAKLRPGKVWCVVCAKYYHGNLHFLCITVAGSVGWEKTFELRFLKKLSH